jgi:ABC-type multidrug transport system ATPase subunit
MGMKVEKYAGYLMQTDQFLQYLTVYETLSYIADLRMPPQMTAQDRLDYWVRCDLEVLHGARKFMLIYFSTYRSQRVNRVIAELGLQHVRDTKIGGKFNRGISGGERRRVSIGVQLLTDPAILFCDEPSTGLDAFTARNIISILNQVQKRSCTHCETCVLT